MFFRRHTPKVPTLAELTSRLSAAGFQVASAASGEAEVHRDGFAAHIREPDAGSIAVTDSGLWLDGEIARLTDRGYQKVFRTASGKTAPAYAEHLKALHDFTEDLRAALGLSSLYNESLGTTNELHLYDRLKNR